MKSNQRRFPAEGQLSVAKIYTWKVLALGTQKMKAVIVSCFDTGEDRVDLVYECLVKRGYDVDVIQSDFCHMKKVQRTEKKRNYIFVKTKPYYKNISLARLHSHYCYARNAFQIVEKIRPDLLYVIVPPNSLAGLAAEYKRKCSGGKLVLDLFDLWPESFPIGKMKNWPPFFLWRLLRNHSLKFADFVITECNLYQITLRNVLQGLKTETVYLAKKDMAIHCCHALIMDEIHLCYLGSINNIIDIDQISRLIQAIHEIKPAVLHIIGDGEKKQLLIDAIQATGAAVQYHGKLYDSQKKQVIFDQCHFALNIMKESVCVGLTMKSIDYFQHGLPILNNIKADTEKIVEQYKAGININHRDVKKVAQEITDCSMKELIFMRSQAKLVYCDLFSQRAFNAKMDNVLNAL